MRRKFNIILLLAILSSINIYGQVDFYDVNQVREIRIYFDQNNWDEILDSLFTTGDGGERLLGSVNIDGTQLDSVGVRFKGFSSWNANYSKNPFNIKLDYVKGSQEYLGVNKIKLSNVIYDPSFVREVLSYEILRKYMPASRANFANVYVNDVLQGLYSNVESVNKDFVESHFGTRDNSFFKGEPEVLVFPFGSNANLEYYGPGDDSTNYIPFYELESDNGWNNLMELIYLINENPDSVGNILNTDRALWMHAFNYSLVNLDSYIAFAQNYYLYMDDNNRFNPIIWDLNMSFASFRHSDGSYHAVPPGLTINDAKNLDPLQHLTFSITPRPLMTNLFLNDTYSRMYIAHIRTILSENFINDDYNIRGQFMQNLIDTYVQNDTGKFYSYNDFLDNFEFEVGGSGGMELYPGIVDLMDARMNYLDTYPGFQGAPEISDIDNSPSFPSNNETVWITANIINGDDVYLGYRNNFRGVFQKLQMFDDGLHHDGAASDGVYGISVTAIMPQIQYYIYAENSDAGIFSPERAEYEYYTINIIGELVINEFMALNDSTVTDQNGEYDDWIELYNNSSTDIDLNGFFMSDNSSDITKWTFPDTSIAAKSYLIIWADEDDQQSGLHASFKLSSSGESLFLSDNNATTIDEISFGVQSADTTFGRYPNGTGPFIRMLPTFAAENTNELVGINDHNIYNEKPSLSQYYPNPFSEQINIVVNLLSPSEINLSIYNIFGQEVICLVDNNLPAGEHTINWGGNNSSGTIVKAGMYLYRLQINDQAETKRVMFTGKGRY